MILTQNIQIRISNTNIKHFISKGYYCKNQDIILVKVLDLLPQSHQKIKVKCDICGEEKEISYYNFNKNIKKYNYYSCSYECSEEKRKQTNLEKFGNEYQINSNNTKEKSKQTKIKKYGNEKFTNPEKVKQTNLQKYGVENIGQVSYIKEKIKQTNLEKYGVYCTLQSEKIKELTKQTNLEKYGVEYPQQSKEISQKSKDTINQNYIQKYPQFNIINKNQDNLIIKCDICNQDYEISMGLFYNRVEKYRLKPCIFCNPIHSKNSGLEIQLLDFIKENYYGEIIENDRDMIGKELDIYLPELKLAFEFNGVYWHSELYRNNNYHKIKSDLCEEKGIQLIHVWEDDWIYKKDIIKSMILNKLGKTSNKIYARKCEIKEIKNSKQFLEHNHIQGFVNSSINIGLFYNQELVSLMTFGKKRKFMNSSSKEGEYELLRFCNKINTNVIGGASRLFSYFIKNYSFTEIISYADRSYSNGKLYYQLGFEFDCETEPNYYYIIDGIRKHRFGYRKDLLIKEGFNPNQSEHEIMIERGISRIYNAGNLKFKIVKK